MRGVARFVCSRRMTGGRIAGAQGMDGTNHEQNRAEREDDGKDPRCRWTGAPSESLEYPSGAHQPDAAHHGEREHAQRAKRGGTGRCGDQDCRGQRAARQQRGP